MSKRFVYVLKNSEIPPRYYTGVTSDVAKRHADHNAGCSVHTANHRPWTVDVVVEFADEPRALVFERYLKSGSGVAFAQRHLRYPVHPMGDRDRRSREIQDRIGKILYQDWAPLGFSDPPHDEYDAYIGGVYRLLASGAGCKQVAEHLAALERDCLGHPQANAERNVAAARKLCDLDVRL